MVLENQTAEQEGNLENERLSRLQEARQREKIGAQKAATLLAAGAARKLNELIAQGHDTTALMIILGLAILKDGLLDWGLNLFGIGFIPIVGQIPGYFVSLTLFYIMFGKGMLKAQMFTRVLIFFLADSLPFVEELPLTVVAVLFAWHGVKERALRAEENLGTLQQKTVEELEEIEEME